MKPNKNNTNTNTFTFTDLLTEAKVQTSIKKTKNSLTVY